MSMSKLFCACYSSFQSIISLTHAFSIYPTDIIVHPPPYFTAGNNSADDYEDSDDEDVHNRFSHYKHLHCETTHHIRCPGYIEDFKVDLKALLTTKVCDIFLLFALLLYCDVVISKNVKPHILCVNIANFGLSGPWLLSPGTRTTIITRFNIYINSLFLF